ncbi:MAG: LamG domain-containing protein [Sedimentisphaerales bacterium]
MSKKLIFLVSFIFVLGVVSPGMGADDPSLMGWWTFDGHSNDVSGNERHGTLNGDPSFGPGVYGQALEFDGDDYVTIDGYKGVLDTSAWSVALWIKTTNGDNRAIVCWGSTGGGNRSELRILDDIIRWNTGVGNIEANTSPTDGEWHHVAVTLVDGTATSSEGIRIYVDGVDDTITSSDPDSWGIVAGEDFGIGFRATHDDRYFIGSIDDVRFYDRVLIAEEILHIMESGGEPYPYASLPTPVDDALIEATWVSLTWSPGGSAISHDVYFGESFDDVNDGTNDTFISNQTKPTAIFGLAGFSYPEGLVTGTTYYWRIDEVNDADPNSPWKGDVWSFTIPPRTAYDISPADGTKFVDPNAELSWTGGFEAKLHHVYFGDNFDDVNDGTGDTYKGASPNTTYTPGTLELDKIYYWRVDEFDSISTHKGDVWSFRTEPFIAITDPNLVCWWTLEEAEGRKVLDLSGHGHHGAFQGDPEWVDGYDGYALHFTTEGDYVVHSLGAASDWPAGTMTVWVKADSIGQDNYSSVFSSHTPNSAGFQIDVDGENPGVFRINPPGDQIIVFGAASTRWTHLALTFDGTSAKLYYNGSWTSSGTLEDTTFNQFAICTNRGAANSLFGIIDDFRIYDKVLTQEEIQLVMRIDPLLAWGPSPANGATPDIDNVTPLTWLAGDNASGHDLYFGTEKEAVAGADTSTADIYRGSQNTTSYTPPEGVEWGGGPYYWRVDENNTDGTVTKGRVWTFMVADFILVDDFETYDANDNQIWYAWHDGLGYGTPDFPPYFAGNGTGAAVGDEATASYTEETIVNGGSHSMPLSYDNNKQGYSKYSEAELTLITPRDWTKNDVSELSLWFRGYPPSVGSFTEAPVGIYTMTASGTDITGTADEFHYAFKMLTGPGSIIAKVESVSNTHAWAKAGVMIRETLEPGSKHALACVTPGNGVAFEGRTAADSDSFSTNEGGITAPYWVKLERDVSGNFAVSHSANGSTWGPVGNSVPTNIPMNSSVYVGLALTSHDAALTCEAVFSNVSITGTVAQQWTSQGIGILGNNPEPMYVALSSNAGTPVVVYHDDPNAAVTDTWTEWVIPLQAFADQGVNLADMDRIAIGLGTQGNVTIPGGLGTMFFDDIRLYRSRPEPEPEPQS